MKGILKARTVAILTAFLMVFAMMPLVAFGEETPEEENAAGGSVYEEPEEGLESETVADGAAANDEEQTFSAKGDTRDVTVYNLWVGGVQVTEDNAGDIFGDGKVSFSPADGGITATLKLNGYNNTNNENDEITPGVITYRDTAPLTIELKGTNVLSAADGSSCAGIWSKGPLVFNGDGQLTANGGSGRDAYYGVISVDSGIVSIPAEQGGAGIKGTSITFEGGTVIATGGGGGNGCSEPTHASFQGRNGGNGIDGDIEVRDGTIEATGGNGGTSADDAIAGGIFNSTGGDGGNGINGSVIVKDGSITATGSKGGEAGASTSKASKGGAGIHAGDECRIELKGGTVSATGAIGGDGKTETGSYNMGIIGPMTIGVGVVLRGGDDKDSLSEINLQNGDYDRKIYMETFSHKHDFTYRADTGESVNTIKATCNGELDCPEEYKNNPITITLNKPTDLTYNGSAKEAGISGYPTTTVKNLAAEPAIKYFKSEGAGSTTISGDPLSGAPVDAGDYVAQIEWGGAIASAAFSIVKPAPAKISGTPFTTMKAKGKTGMTVAWEKVEGADGYDVFFSRCNHDDKKMNLKVAETIQGSNTLSWTTSGLKAGKTYKAYIKAYVMKDGKKQYVKTSPLMHAYANGYNKKHTNAKSVKVKKTKVSVKKGKTFKLKAKVKKLKKGKKLMPKSHVATVRYLSTDTSIATVSKKGKIKGVNKGTCYVYAYAHNGVFKKITVTVK